MPRRLRHDRAHDYAYLIQRWRKLAKRTGLKMSRCVKAGGQELFFLESTRAGKDAPSLYFSAGIHGDEPGATEGLLAWAEKNAALLRKVNVLIFPCLNPWGLIGNCRLDSEGRDLNRSYNDTSVPQIGAQIRILGDRRFDLALALHEDYDAHGVYIYEVPSQKKHWGELMIKAATRHLPADQRRKIEGRAATGGVVRRSIKPDTMPDWPEAFILHFHHSARTFTIETPSEFHLDDRVDAQVAVISRAVELCEKEFSLRRRAEKA